MSGIPVMQVRDNSVVIYYEQMFNRRYANNRASRHRMKEARKGRYSGKMTVGTRKRMVKAITLMCQIARPKWVLNDVTGQWQWHRLSFITLTVSNPKNMTAKEGYRKMLSHFLQWMRREHGMDTYVWKAELQVRGQLHYHLTTPTFVPWQKVRAEWNRLQKNAGVLDDFAKNHGHADPNSTQVNETKHVRNMASYIVKELAKSLQNETETEGKIWDCSNNLSSAKYFSLVMTAQHQRIIEAMRGSKEIREVVGDFWSITYFSDASPPDLLLNDQEKKRFNEHLQGIIRQGREVEEMIAIPAEAVSAAIDVDKIYSWSQLQLLLN